MIRSKFPLCNPAFFFILCFSLVSCASAGQSRGEVIVGELTVEEDLIKPGSFAEGSDAVNIQYPLTCRNMGISGTVTLFVDIDQYGSPVDVKVARGIGGGCDEEAAMKLRRAFYTPALDAEGEPVAARHWVTVSFN